jgi:hypothetical protein
VWEVGGSHDVVFSRVFHINLARRSILGWSLYPRMEPKQLCCKYCKHQQLGPRLSPVFSVRFMYFG